ncbi:hypothetical protein [Methanosarcina horonobensis]|uniref:hypothetical protein n=1 Tax=Methanosarcina horonobensis TaxID=418008 RepID=UPI000A6012FC|nr:hypothetical protein [Methanosarcina horonobensis]
MGPFANYIAKAVDENLTLYLSISGGNDELLPLKELAMETPYSQEYLSLRARQGLLDAVKIGKTWHSSKHAVGQYLSEHGKKRIFDFCVFNKRFRGKFKQATGRKNIFQLYSVCGL